VIVTIDRLGHLGHGIARMPDSGPIYVPGTLPGEVVEGTLDGDILLDPKIVTPSASRVKPPCRHARACGGCQLQHASGAFVAQWKQQVVETALAGQGLAADFLPLVTSPARSRRRATLSARRTKSGVLIGFHARASDTIAEIPDCQLLHPGILAAVPGLQALVMAGGSRTTELSLQVTLTRGGPDVVVTGGKPLDSALRMDLARLVETHGFSRLTWDGETVALRDRPALTMGHGHRHPPRRRLPASHRRGRSRPSRQRSNKPSARRSALSTSSPAPAPSPSPSPKPWRPTPSRVMPR